LNTICVLFTLAWISVLGVAIYVPTKNTLIPILCVAVAIMVTSIAGLLPMWMIAVSIALGALTLFLWRRV